MKERKKCWLLQDDYAVKRNWIVVSESVWKIKVQWGLLHLWQADNLWFRLNPLSSCMICFEIQIRISCWIISTTDIPTLQGQVPPASLSAPAPWQHEWLSEVTHSVPWVMWLPPSVCLDQTLIIMQPCGAIWGNHRTKPAWGKGLKEDFHEKNFRTPSK